MTRTTDGSRSQVKRYGYRWWWLILLASYLTASCVMSPRGRQLGRHHWNGDRGPVVPHDSFPADCTLCHERDNWSKLRSDFQFDHARETGVPLIGAHGQAQCLRCHNDRGPVSVFARRGCSGCHDDVHRGQLGIRCGQCHNEDNWVPQGQIALHNRTRFPLVGAHTAVACFRCHPGAPVGNLVRAPVECAACHQPALARAKNPDHVAQGWTHDCDRCHQPITWSGATFHHTRFPLTGAHRAVACTDCHTNGTFSAMPHDCVSCHLADFQSTRNPDHVAGNFSTDCQSCHNTVSWQGARFNHNGITSNCVQCHLPNYNNTTNPNHAAAGFSTVCEDCHNTVSWLGGGFNHNGITNNCDRCHLPNYNNTTNPNHAALGYPTTCESCHNTNAWRPANFNHGGITNNCDRCHLTDYNGTTNPNHAALGYPTTCESCHNTNAWRPANFNHVGITNNCDRCHLPDYNGTTHPNHAALGYPITCESCHNTNAWIPANFNHNGITNNCDRCHSADYNNTTNPSHIAAGFPRTCEMCHNTFAWRPANFNHTFNINSGPHKNYTCAECHQVPTNYSIVSCTHCHEHAQSPMNNKHSGVNGYSWSSPACINCHPQGKK